MLEDKFSGDVALSVLFMDMMHNHLSFVTRKPVFGVSDQDRLKPACAATEAR